MPNITPAPRPPRSIRVDLTPRTVLLVVATSAAVWLTLALLPVVLVVVVGLMIAGTIAPLVAWFEKRGVGRRWAVAIAFGAMLAFCSFVAVITVPPLIQQATDIVEGLPSTQIWLASYLRRHAWSAPFAESAEATHVPEIIVNAAKAAISYSPQIAAVIGGAVTAVFLAMYMLVDRDRLRGALFAVVPRRFHLRLSRILLGLETIVGGYMRGQAITSLMMAVFTFAVLSVANVPNAVALAVFAGLVDVLPYIGAILATAPAVVAALSLGPTTALIVLIVLAAYEEFESRFIIPRVYGRVLRLPSAVIVVALLAGGKLLGILGALLALPVAAAIRLVVEELRFELPGEPPEDPLVRAREEQGEREYRVRTVGVTAVKAAEVATEIAGRPEEEDPAPTLRRADVEASDLGSAPS